MSCLKEVMKDYRSEVQVVLSADRQLANEIEFDLKRFEEQQKEQLEEQRRKQNTPSNSPQVWTFITCFFLGYKWQIQREYVIRGFVLLVSHCSQFAEDSQKIYQHCIINMIAWRSCSQKFLGYDFHVKVWYNFIFLVQFYSKWRYFLPRNLVNLDGRGSKGNFKSQFQSKKSIGLRERFYFDCKSPVAAWFFMTQVELASCTEFLCWVYYQLFAVNCYSGCCQAVWEHSSSGDRVCYPPASKCYTFSQQW